MPRTSADIEQARIAIASRGTGEPARLLELAIRLRQDNQVGWARKVLEAALECAGGAGAAERVDIRLELALCTYKDPDLPLADRLNRALAMVEAVLEDFPGLPPERRQQALGIAGSIHKQRWSVHALKSALEAARACYLEAYRLGIESDLGYTAVNAAFTLDLLADQERDPSGAPTPTARQMQAQAEGIRDEVIRSLARFEGDEYYGRRYWFALTLAEANLGTGRHEKACQWVRAAAAIGMEGWQLETAARQLAHLARLEARKEGLPPEELERSQAWTVVEALLGGNTAAALSFFRGKVGLALSGGGFRASLYHIGVLAKLAELDMLRHVEVISCVSGGSILGAYYYLELKHLLETRPDAEITREHYLALVRRIERNFLAGVQRNIRNRMLLEFGTNLKSLFSRRPPASERLGEIYERELYSRIDDGTSGPRYLTDLMVRPFGAGEFRPKYDNWQRLNKVPILVLNSATLNTCHSWQFTASYMGEPPARGIDNEIDANHRFRRMYHEEAPPAFRKLRLGWAVAASACVPGLFDPLLFDGMYEGGYITRLVDGGVYDNQGVASLLEQDCTVLLVSDASGQTGMEKDPPDHRLGVPARANSILMARVREAQFQLLAHLRDASVLSGLMYVHLKKDLDSRPLDWVGCPDPSAPPRHALLTRYGIRKDVQALISGIRTDLDSFSDVEADALMLSGYKMTGTEFARSIQGFPVPSGPETQWRFRDLQPIAGDPGASAELAALEEVLRAAACLSFKAWKMSPALRYISHGLTAALVLAVALLCRRYWAEPAVFSFSLTGRGAAMVAGAAASLVLLKMWALPRWLRYRNHFSQCALSLAACLVGWAVLLFHLRLIDPLWIRSGPRYRRPEEGESVRSAGAAAGGSE
ncbi:MAG TPA: patatin-like phospholipase family protein [Bryobacteraceae bacterium]|nr:patatin-like phospholipase family protein [Bryobacteraceae bacterium]